jgi:hypothetical protein
VERRHYYIEVVVQARFHRVEGRRFVVVPIVAGRMAVVRRRCSYFEAPGHTSSVPSKTRATTHTLLVADHGGLDSW